MYIKYGESLKANSLNVRENKLIMSFSATIDIKEKLNNYCIKNKITKTSFINSALNKELNKKERKINMKKVQTVTLKDAVKAITSFVPKAKSSEIATALNIDNEYTIRAIRGKN